MRGIKMRLMMYSPYDHFPNHNMVKGEKYITCLVDYIAMREKGIDKSKAIAILIEPRSLNPELYRWMEYNGKEFAMVFTHDSQLLSLLPNSRLILWGGGQEGLGNWNDSRWNKLKNISFCSSAKEMCAQHIIRKALCKELEDKVDCMGTYDGGSYVTTAQIYEEYKFSICIENYLDDWWFTEKIGNAFANKCVPIYYGARKIGRLFDEEGIIRVDNINDIPKIVDKILINPHWEYGKRSKAIDYNYERVKEFDKFEQWFFGRYGDELDELYEKINRDNSCV